MVDPPCVGVLRIFSLCRAYRDICSQFVDRGSIDSIDPGCCCIECAGPFGCNFDRAHDIAGIESPPGLDAVHLHGVRARCGSGDRGTELCSGVQTMKIQIPRGIDPGNIHFCGILRCNIDRPFQCFISGKDIGRSATAVNQAVFAWCNTFLLGNKGDVVVEMCNLRCTCKRSDDNHVSGVRDIFQRNSCFRGKCVQSGIQYSDFLDRCIVDSHFFISLLNFIWSLLYEYF